MKWTNNIRIVSATPASESTILINWSDGSRRLFDAAPHMHGDYFDELGDPLYFAKLRIASHGETVEWPNGQDFAPETLFEESRLIGFEPNRAHGIDAGEENAPAMRALEARKDGTILIDWSDGSRRLFDTWAHAGGFIDALSDASYVAQAKIAPAGNGVTWPNGEGFSAAEVFAKSVALKRETSVL